MSTSDQKVSPVTGARLHICVAAVCALPVLALAGCTSGLPPTESAPSPLGAVRCSSPSPVLNADTGPEVVGTSDDGITLYGQIQVHDFFIASDAVKKVVWRVSGTGEPIVTLTSPSGEESTLAWGPEFHASSNYVRPGDEYGSGLILDEPGCWNIDFSRDAGSANVQLEVST